jgi:hypothetical protein
MKTLLCSPTFKSAEKASSFKCFMFVFAALHVSKQQQKSLIAPLGAKKLSLLRLLPFTDAN